MFVVCVRFCPKCEPTFGPFDSSNNNNNNKTTRQEQEVIIIDIHVLYSQRSD
jgi:hypothetical protein